MKYQVLNARFNEGLPADVVFATNDRQEAIQVAKDYGQGTVVMATDKNGKQTKVFTAPYKTDLGIGD